MCGQRTEVTIKRSVEEYIPSTYCWGRCDRTFHYYCGGTTAEVEMIAQQCTALEHKCDLILDLCIV